MQSKMKEALTLRASKFPPKKNSNLIRTDHQIYGFALRLQYDYAHFFISFTLAVLLLSARSKHISSLLLCKVCNLVKSIQETRGNIQYRTKTFSIKPKTRDPAAGKCNLQLVWSTLATYSNTKLTVVIQAKIKIKSRALLSRTFEYSNELPLCLLMNLPEHASELSCLLRVL